jgi:hypothetical protein
MTINASGIRDITGVLRIIPNTVLTIIKAAAQTVQRRRWYDFDRERKRIVAYVNGQRTEANCRA